MIVEPLKPAIVSSFVVVLFIAVICEAAPRPYLTVAVMSVMVGFLFVLLEPEKDIVPNSSIGRGDTFFRYLSFSSIL